MVSDSAVVGYYDHKFDDRTRKLRQLSIC